LSSPDPKLHRGPIHRSIGPGRFSTSIWIPALILAGLTALVACNGGGGGGGAAIGPGQLPNTLTFENVIRRVTWNPPPQGKGETEAVVQFSLRDPDGNPLGIDDVTVTMLVDDRPLDPEAIIDRKSTKLESNIRYGLVLDSSPSMLIPGGVPFLRMKTAAAASVKSLEDVWAGHAGRVDWTFSWFNDRIYLPYGGELSSAHLLQIPEPKQGEFTKLHAAVHQMALQLGNEYRTGRYASNERDMHVMVVFSDGKDNYSYQSNTNQPPSSGVLGGEVHYRAIGYPSVDLNDALEVLRRHPKLTVHTIGLGSQIDEAELRAIANDQTPIDPTRPEGRFVRGTTTDIGRLFDRITREFTTVQTHGARMPLQKGDYRFTVNVVSKLNALHHGSLSFDFHAGDAEAGVRPRAPTFLSEPIETATVAHQYLYPIQIDAWPAARVTVTGLPGWLQYSPSKLTLTGIPTVADVGQSPVITVDATNGEFDPGYKPQEFAIDVHLLWNNEASGTWRSLRDVWGNLEDASRDELVAVGDNGTALRFQAGGWSPLGSPPSTSGLNGVWGSSLKNLYAVGGGDIIHFDGTAWRAVIIGYTNQLNKVWGAGPDDVFIVGNGGTLLRYDGKTLRFLTSGTANDLNDVWGESPNSVFVVGSGGVILHHDGQSWEPMVSGTLEDLHAVWGTSSWNVFAVGAKGTVLHFDGKLWTEVYSGTDRDLLTIWGISPSDVFAAGTLGTILHYNGSNWKPMNSWTSNTLYGVWGSRSDFVRVAGSGGLILKYGDR